jgi:protein TonB
LEFYRKAAEQGYDGADKDVERVCELIESLRVFEVVEEDPEFPGGMNGVARYLLDNLKYPTVSLENNSQGRALVQFVVNSDGSVQDVEINRSTGDAYLDKEAVRVVKAMPNWKPGRHRGKVVRVKFILQVNFRLQR